MSELNVNADKLKTLISSFICYASSHLPDDVNSLVSKSLSGVSSELLFAHKRHYGFGRL